jgi:ferredoxin
MPDDEERTVLGLRLRIDRALCVGFGDCITAAPSAFRLDEEGIAVFADPDCAGRATLLRACESCPVDALTAWDEHGNQLAP